MELAKLYGSPFGHPARETYMLEIEEELMTSTLLGNALATFSATYPRWDVAGFVGELIPIWRRCTELSAVRFVTNNGTDVMEDMAQGD